MFCCSRMHHIVSDGWSMGVLSASWPTLYAAFARAEPSPLPELPVQYADYAVWQREWLQGEVLAAAAGLLERAARGSCRSCSCPPTGRVRRVLTFEGARLGRDVFAGAERRAQGAEPAGRRDRCS